MKGLKRRWKLVSMKPRRLLWFPIICRVNNWILLGCSKYTCIRREIQFWILDILWPAVFTRKRRDTLIDTIISRGPQIWNSILGRRLTDQEDKEFSRQHAERSIISGDVMYPGFKVCNEEEEGTKGRLFIWTCQSWQRNGRDILGIIYWNKI